LNIEPVISNEFRKGDVRHCFGDISRAKKLLGYEPKISIEKGFRDLTIWAKEHNWQAIDCFDESIQKMHIS